MNDFAAHRACIAPVPPGTPRPLWSVMIPAFNCARYLSATLESVLAQDPGPEAMQIEVVDDHSSQDDSRAVVAGIGRGRVDFYRQARHLGITRNLATCLDRSCGQLVHLLHGDDCVREGFYTRLQQLFARHAEIGAAFCRHVFIDAQGNELTVSTPEQSESGVLQNALERLALEQRIMAPSMVVRRKVYEHLGGFDDRLICSEDWEMWVRIAAHYPIGYEVIPLAAYRMHENSNTGRHRRSAADMRYTRHAIEIFKAYLPQAAADGIVRRARETYALSAVDGARTLLRKRDVVGALAQAREALRFRRSPHVWAKVLRTFLLS